MNYGSIYSRNRAKRTQYKTKSRENRRTITTTYKYDGEGNVKRETRADGAYKSYTEGVMRKEVRFSTPGGYKSNRYADKVEFVKNEVVCIHQVGKVSKNGLPVVRESRAIEDIMLSPNYNGAPIYFWPYNSFSGPIIYY